MTASYGAIPAPILDLAAGESGFDHSVLRAAIAKGGPAFFPRQRWFGDKSRTIASATLADLAFGDLVTSEPVRIALTIVDVSFDDGGRERYFVPLALVAAGEATSGTLIDVRGPDAADSARLDDALARPDFHAWLLDPVASPGASGSMSWRPGTRYSAAVDRANIAESRVSRAEQSNSAVIYGNDLLVKVFRKLRSGLNPDIEIGRFLSEETTFRQFPELLGDLSYGATEEDVYSIAMTLPFVPNVGDAWDYFQSRLGDLLLETAVDLDLVAPFRWLGRRTGQLHCALATPTLDAAFAAEPITAADVRDWTSGLTAATDRTVASLRQRIDLIPPALRPKLEGLTSQSPAMAVRIAGFQALQGIAKIRVHGDYHLGQTLVTADEDFVIIDFEGEPTRSMEERRAKTSPLKDVAGMLRSISYARAGALRARPTEISEVDADARLRQWEDDASDAFLAGYRDVTIDLGVSFLPEDPVAFDAALAAWELDKAVYEVNYELNNRPDWLPLPLGALLGE